MLAFADPCACAQVVLAGAGHACYRDAPDAFHQELTNWMMEFE